MAEQASREWWEELLQVYEFAHYRQYADELTRREVDFLIDALGLQGLSRSSIWPAAVVAIAWRWRRAGGRLPALMLRRR